MNNNMNKKIIKVVNAISIAGIGLLASIMTGYSVLWLWILFDPGVCFAAGLLGLVGKILASATILMTVWLVPSTIIFLLKNGKKYVRGELKTVSMDKYVSLIKSKNELIEKLAAEAAKYRVEAAHFKAVAEAYKKELDSLESTTEE